MWSTPSILLVGGRLRKQLNCKYLLPSMKKNAYSQNRTRSSDCGFWIVNSCFDRLLETLGWAVFCMWVGYESSRALQRNDAGSFSNGPK